MATVEIFFWQSCQDADHVVLIVLQPLAAACNEFYWSCIFQLRCVIIYD